MPLASNVSFNETHQKNTKKRDKIWGMGRGDHFLTLFLSILSSTFFLSWDLLGGGQSKSFFPHLLIT